MHISKLLLALTFIFSITSVYAEEVSNTQDVTTATKNTRINNTIIGNLQDWNLTSDEWSQYQKLMQGPDAHWYPNLTPPEILGLNAQTPVEQQHFADIVAKEEHDKLARELQFNKAVHHALLRLYPNEPVIRPFHITAFNPIQTNKQKDATSLQPGDHLIVFVDIQHGLDFLVLPRLLSEIKQHSSVVLDIYCEGANDDNGIRTWAKLNQIPMPLVNEGRITLNQNKGQLQKTVGNVQLPYLLLVHEGKSTPVSIWSLS